ncbi:response regulator transcription factor [Chloroflexota bacterium]
MMFDKKKILVVDDDRKTAELVKLYLEKNGYKVLTAYDGEQALETARRDKPDLLVLDLMLPGIGGLEVCRAIRSESDIPVIMLTAKTTEQDKLTGLDLGADDYVTKPFSPKELVARVRAVLRRAREEYSGLPEVSFGDFSVNFPRHEVTVNGKSISLTPAEFRLLAVLTKEPGRVFSRSQLIDKAFSYDFEGFDRTIDVHILNLRRKIEPDRKSPRFIKGVYGVGYKFEAE